MRVSWIFFFWKEIHFFFFGIGKFNLNVFIFANSVERCMYNRKCIVIFKVIFLKFFESARLHHANVAHYIQTLRCENKFHLLYYTHVNHEVICIRNINFSNKHVPRNPNRLNLKFNIENKIKAKFPIEFLNNCKLIYSR